VDVALLPINGRDYFREAANVVGNLSGRESAEIAAAIGADLVVPMHYDAVPGNTESVGFFVDHVQRTHPGLSVFVPAHVRPFVYTRPD
jgi:L-ascorbate metabolism protein UlaG (beta-lactamase superfamily)